MESGLISVIVPVFQAAETIKKCIDSILEQTYNNLQIIIIDDGSTDESGDICEAYKKQDLRIIVVHTHNQGSVLAREAGLNIAEGEYVCFVDADDYIKPDLFMKLHAAINESGSDFVHSWFMSEYPTGIVCDVAPYNDEFSVCTSDDREELFNRYVLSDRTKLTASMWSKIYKTEFAREAYSHIQKEQCFGEDYLFLLCCLANCKKINVIDACDYVYCIREKSLSHLDNKDVLQKRVELLSAAIKINAELNYPIKNSKLEFWIRNEMVSTLRNTNEYLSRVGTRYYISDIEKYKDKKLVLYGAGNVGKDFLLQLYEYEYEKPVAILDKKKKSLLWDEFAVHEPEYILDKEYDVIIIAVYNEDVAETIAEELVSIGVPRNKIIWEFPNR